MDVKKDICSDFFIITIWEEKKMKGKVKKGWSNMFNDYGNDFRC